MDITALHFYKLTRAFFASSTRIAPLKLTEDDTKCAVGDVMTLLLPATFYPTQKNKLSEILNRLSTDVTYFIEILFVMLGRQIEAG